MGVEWAGSRNHFFNFLAYIIYLERMKLCTAHFLDRLIVASASVRVIHYPRMGRVYGGVAALNLARSQSTAFSSVLYAKFHYIAG